MRILYVALTRAKERLYVTGSYSRSVMPTIKAQTEFLVSFNCDHARLSASSYMEWILSAIQAKSITKGVILHEFTTDRLPSVSKGALCVEAEVTSADTAFNEEFYQRLKEKFDFKYSFSDIGRIPAKISVSKLSPDVLDTTDTSLDIFDSERSMAVPEFFLTSEKKISSSERGIATHLFFQFCDFEFLKEHSASEALHQLVEKGFIPERLANMIYLDELDKFKNSEFMQRIVGAKRIIREQRFNILLPTSDFTRQPDFKEKIANEKIAVQGVIDLILIDDDGNIELYDYKTDRLSRAELNDTSLAQKKLDSSHALQLSYYKKAITLLFGKAPLKVAIYSTHSAKLFDIQEKNLSIPHDIL